MNKLLTIIVPSYNMEAFLPQCLDSLIVSDKGVLDSIDVIIVNDGSLDRTSVIAHRYEMEHPNVFRVIDKRNGHYGSCVNAALPIASGLFIKILDADDSYDIDQFEKWLKHISHMEETGACDEVDCLLTDYVTVDNHAKILGLNQFMLRPNAVLDIQDIPAHHVYPMHAVAWRTDMLRRIGYRQSEGILYTDTEWAVYPLVHIRKLLYLPFPVYRYLVGREGQSMDPQVFRKNMNQRVRMFARMLEETRQSRYSAVEVFRMHYVAVTGIHALFDTVARNYRGADRIQGFSDVDCAIREYAPEFYGLFESAPMVRSWRENGRFTIRALARYYIERVARSLSGTLKRLLKFVFYTARNLCSR